MSQNMYPISTAKIQIFFQTGQLRRYKKRDLVINANDMSSSVFYMKEGYLRVFRISEQGEELTLTILKPGDIFPLTYGFNNLNNFYYIEAITKVELWKSSQEGFLNFVKENTDVLYELTNRIMVRFAGVLSRMEYIVFSNAYIKVAATLLICAKKFGEQQGDEIIVRVPLTHHDIATLIGITRETTSLEMKKLEKQGFLGKAGRLFVIKDMKRLEEVILLASQENTVLNYSL